jgi:tRNA pseudouridine32 synthase / 23S rRNA pseudouridine746 synthase
MPSLLHLDSDLIVALKPAGLLAVPGRGADKQDCLSARLAAQHGEIHIVHRLDQATSGLMVFARNKAALQHLHQQFAQRTVGKAYEAMVLGQPHSERFSIDLPLMADWPNRPRQKVDLEQGRPSLTHVQMLSWHVDTGTSRARLVPVTGRTHQLRVHLHAVGHGIVGDLLYGNAQREQTPPAASRLMLHACELAFTHPSTGQRMILTSPADF